MHRATFLPLLAALCWFSAPALAADPGPLELHARSRQETAADSGRYHAVEKTLKWKPQQTAIVICDMWDKHWCPTSTDRVAEMAPRMNEVVQAARARGVLIIHCPSDTMEYYKDTPQRKLAQAAPKVETKIPLERWCHLDKEHESPLPIDDSKGGCDCTPRPKSYRAWSKQIDAIEIAEGDAITDSAEAFYLMKQRGINNVIVMGVHTNMCVLGRPFSIRQMVYQGQNVVLMRDMTDTMYDPASRPYVSHFTGTDLVVEHIERHWCPTITSADFLGGQPFRFKHDKRPHLAIVMAESEYKTETTLPPFALSQLGQHFKLSYVYADSQDRNHIPGLNVLDEADIALFAIRRRVLPKEQLAIVRRFVQAGKPLVGIRTTSHAFSLRGNRKTPDGHEQWPEWDAEVIGGSYTNHHGNGPTTTVTAAKGAQDHPILHKVDLSGFTSKGSLYKSAPLQKTATPLLLGSIPDAPAEPVAWINRRKDGGQTFYTSLGHVDDFQNPAFVRLLANAVYTLAGLDVALVDEPAKKQNRQLAQADAGQGVPDWMQLRVPGIWEELEQAKLGGYDGFAWYRCAVMVPENWKGTDLSLTLEDVDNAFEVYLDGRKVGAAGSFPPKYQSGLRSPGKFTLPVELIRPGKYHLLAIRVYDNDGRGGFKGKAPVLSANQKKVISLAGKWQFRTGDDLAWAKGSADPARTGLPAFSKLTSADQPQQAKAPQGPLSPEESRKKLVVNNDLVLEQVLSEPIVGQPIFVNFDERGRMWVVQYLQYPYPAGLKMLSRDKYWRAVYDKVPPPPPNHFKGRDKITIHEDTNGDGTFDKHKTFLDGLNIATSCARGRGGVWVLNPPYLLFYPDQNNDDVPDGDPVVHLQGFGLEDTHSVVNNLTFGPDGWLYAAQGSTVSGDVKRPGDKQSVHSMGQLIWRYHPESRRYEIFAEGGGNAFGVEIDSKGRIFSGHNGGNTRGFHYVQGAYYRKGFGKHGPLSNPYAYGYFQHMQHPSVPRFTHDFLIYEGASLPEKYHRKLFAVAPLQSHVVYSEVLPDGSSFQTKDLGYPLTSGDKWFRPVHITSGPDGAIYVCDMYEQQISHRQHFEGQVHRGNGRIYRLQSPDAEPLARFDMNKESTEQLIHRLAHPNRWFRQTALRVLGDRQDQDAIGKLKNIVQKETGQLALEALWSVYQSGGFDDAFALRGLNHDDPYVRQWTVRLLGDANQVAPAIAARLAKLAESEPHVAVRSQLASTAKRLSAQQGLPIVRHLLARDEDASDIHLPLLLWWAMEDKAESDRDQVLAVFKDKRVWNLPLVEQHILARIMRRYAQAGGRQNLLTCAKLLELSPGKPQTQQLMAGFEEAYHGRALVNLPAELVEIMAKRGGASLALEVRQGKPEALKQALSIVADEQADEKKRIQFAQIFGEIKHPPSVPVLLSAVAGAKSVPLRKTSLVALQQYEDPSIPQHVLAALPKLPADVQTAAFTMLVSRKSWARRLLSAIDAKQLDRNLVPLDVVWQMQLHPDKEIAGLIEKHWGSLKEATAGEIKQKIESLTVALQEGSGDPYLGKRLFEKTCAKCHTLFNEGGKIGPDLTTYKRDDLTNMLLHVVNPSAEIREGFETYVAITADGRTATGFLVDKDNQVVVLRGVDGQNITLKQDNVEEMIRQRKSLMPEGLLKDLGDEEIRNLFSYLRTSQPLNE